MIKYTNIFILCLVLIHPTLLFSKDKIFLEHFNGSTLYTYVRNINLEDKTFEFEFNNQYRTESFDNFNYYTIMRLEIAYKRSYNPLYVRPNRVEPILPEPLNFNQPFNTYKFSLNNDYPFIHYKLIEDNNKITSQPNPLYENWSNLSNQAKLEYLENIFLFIDDYAPNPPDFTFNNHYNNIYLLYLFLFSDISLFETRLIRETLYLTYKTHNLLTQESFNNLIREHPNIDVIKSKVSIDDYLNNPTLFSKIPYLDESFLEFLYSKVTPNQSDNEGNNLLHYSAIYDALPSITLLLNNGSNPNNQNSNFETPFILSQSSEAVHLFLTNVNTNPAISGNKGSPLLYFLRIPDHKVLYQYLISLHRDEAVKQLTSEYPENITPYSISLKRAPLNDHEYNKHLFLLYLYEIYRLPIHSSIKSPVIPNSQRIIPLP